MKQKITYILLGVLEDILIMNGLSSNKEFNENSRLIGKGGLLDSLAFVTFLVAAEQKVNSDFNKNISLTNEKAFSRNNNPFRTVKTLTEYIVNNWE